MKNIIALLIFFCFSNIYSEQSFFFSYKDHIESNKKQLMYHYYYKKNLKNININFYINYSNLKNNSITIYHDWFFKNYMISLNAGNYFLDPIWNQFVFLAEDPLEDRNFPIRRKFKGIYLSFFPYNLNHSFGFFYLEDESKGVYLYNKYYLILFDFIHKNYMYYHNLKSKYFYYYVNIGGVKKDLYGFSSFRINPKKESFLQLFLLRNPLWDQYDYFLDKYNLEKRFSPSFLSTFLSNYKNFDFHIYYFNKGNIIYTKTSFSINVIHLNGYDIKTGYSYLESMLEREYKTIVSRYLIQIQKKSNYNYNITYEWNPWESLIKFSIGKKNKHLNFYNGFMYFNYNIKQIQKSYDFFMIYQDESQVKNYLVDKDYIAIISEVTYKSNFLNLHFNYTFENKFINKFSKKIHTLNFKLSIKFL